MAIDDYDSDVQFGAWLREKRVGAGFSLEQVAEKSAISIDRLKSLEVGYADRSITRAESERLSAVYGLTLQECIDRAIRSP